MLKASTVAVTLFVAAASLAHAADTDSSGAYEAAMKKMHSDTASPSGDPDKDFAAMMIPHHQAAADMAKVELQYGKDPTLRKMATKIVRSQEAEIRDMQRWQVKHQH